MNKLFVCLGVIGMLTASAQAIVITQWTFETSVPTTAGPHAAEVGTGSATGYHASSSTVYSNPSGNGSLESFSSNYWLTVGDYYQFQTNTTGWSNLVLSFDQTRSSTGPSAFEVLYSTNGTTWTQLATYTVNSASWSSVTPLNPPTTSYSYALPAALNNQATAYVRLSLVTAVTATAGTSRVDNVTITPEPTTLCLLGLGSLVLGLRRRGN